MGKLYMRSGKHYVAKKKEPKKLYIGSTNQDINGAAYLGGKVAAGAASIGVGAWNFIAGAFDQITGNTYAAEKRYAENSARAFSEKLDSMYDANGAMQFAGAVAEGVGQFIPTALISMIPVAGVPLAQGIQFAGYTGMNVEDAYKKTGNLGGREYLYGAALGGFETALEFVGGKVGGWIGGTKVGGKLLGVSDNVAGAAMKATSGKIGTRAATVGARTLMGGTSEFTEEFIEAYAEVGLQRALQIDPNASIKLGEALYAGAVGFASGAAMSGTASVLNTKGAQMTGARIMNAGETDMTIAAAVEISSAFKASGRLESEVHKALQDNLALWENVSDKTSGDAQMILGNIEVAMNVLSAMAAQQGTVSAVIANPEKFLPYAQALFGKSVTLADLKSADSRVVRFIAASNWATGESDALAIRAKRSRFTSAIEAEMQGGQEIPSITQFKGVNGDAVYKSPDGDYIFLSEGKNGLYTVMKGKDLDNLRAFQKDGSAAIDASEVQGALVQMLTEQSNKASAEEQSESRASVATKSDVIEISNESELAKLIEQNPDRNPHDIIKEYLIKNFGGQTFVLSDGRQAIMDKRDAAKLSVHTDKKSVAQLGGLREMIEKARFDHSALDVDHKKFKEFHYYVAVLQYGSKQYEIWLNVGTAKNDGTHHIYDIREKREEAPTQKGVSRPEGNAIGSASSTNSIPQNGGNVNSEQTKNSLGSQEGEKATEKKAEEKPKESDTEGEKDAAGKENASERPKGNVLSDKTRRERARLIDEYDAEVQDKARKLLGKRVDKLSADRRIAIYDAILSGKGLDKDVLRAACYFISKRPGLYIRFDKDAAAVDAKTVKGGFHKIVWGGKARLVLAANGPKGLRKVLIHEVFHDIASTKAGDALIRAALEATSLEEAYGTAKLYGDFYAKAYEAKGVETFEKFFADGKYDKESKESVLEAIGAYEKKYASVLPRDAITEELVADTVAERIGNEKFLKMAKDTNAAGLILRGVRRMLTYLKTEKAAKPFYVEAVELENLFLDAVQQPAEHSEGTRLSLSWESAIEQLDENNFDASQNTHLQVLEHTPQIYIDTAGAKDRKIAMGWDIAYLAMKKNGDVLGHYHGLGADVMKALPKAIADPLFIVKQKNGRIAAVTKIVVKGKRAVFASIELESFKTTVQDGKSEADVYNLVVTVTDAKPNYLQNTVFGGEIVYNKNKEDPAHFILRLKSLEKALPAYDLAGSSINSIPQNGENVNREAQENSSETRLSLSAADADYLDAVKRGDMEAAQRMVDEAAKNAGYDIKAYHGTPNTEFTVFDKERVGKGNDQYGAGFYFTTDKTGASHYGNRVIDAALSIKNPIRFTATAESGRNLIDADIMLTSEQAYEVVKRLPGIYDAEESPLGDYFDAYWEVGAKDWMIRELAEQYRDVGYLDSDLFRNHPNELHEALRDVVGYDGVEVTFERTGEKFYVAWFDNQMKSTDPVTYDDNGNVIPLSQRFNAENDDIRYSLTAAEDTVARSNRRKVSKGVHEKEKAELGRGLFYLLKDMRESLKSFVESGYYVAEGIKLHVRAKDLTEVARYLWEQSNTKNPDQMDGAADVVADYLLARMMVEYTDVSEGKKEALAARRILKPYYRNLALSEERRAEIRAALPRASAERFIKVFGAKEGGVDLDGDIADINAQLDGAGLVQYRINAENDMDALVAFANLYDSVRALEGERAMAAAGEIFNTAEDVESFRAELKKSVLEAMKENGKPGMLRVLTEKKDAAYDRLYERWRETRDKYEGAVKTQYGAAHAVFLAKEIGEMVKTHKYISAADLLTPEMEAVGQILASIATPRKVKDKQAREAMKLLLDWYTPQNLDGDGASENGDAIETSLYHPDIREKMERIAAGDENAQLTYEELRDLAQVLNAIRMVIKNYDAFYIDGRRESATECATTETTMLAKYLGAGKADGNGFIGKMFHNAGEAVGKKLKQNFLYRVMTPRQVVQSLEWYDKDGVLTRAFDEVQRGVAGAGSDYADMMRPVLEFFDSHKKYEKRLTKTFILYEGEEMSVAQAISLYMTTKREQAALGFETSGFRYMGKDGKVRQARPRAAEEIREEISAALSADDRAYIKVLERVFDRARELKVQTDMAYFGYSNVEDGYYFPISRDTMSIAKRVSDLRQTMRDLAVVGNKSFNKNTKKGANNALFIADVTMVTEAHAMGVSQYANLFMPLSSWDRLWTKKVPGANGEDTTVREIIGDKVWTGRNKRDIADSYFRQLFADIQGVRAEKRDGDGFYAALRSTYVSAALGFNLSSILKQTGSFASAMVYLSPMDLVRGLGMNLKTDRSEMWKYSKVANARMFERGRFVSADANTRLESMSRGVKKFGEMTMAGVEGMDNMVVGRLWNACQQNIARTQGLAIGTVENKVAAGKLLDTVINETQSSSTQDTRSAFQRGGSLAQTLTMFTSDAVKQVSFLYEGAARVYSARLRRKMGEGSDAEVKAANKFLGRSIASFAASTALMVAITQLIKWLLGREREEGETVVEDVAEETLGQVLGIFPLVSDIYGKIANNYDVDSFAFDAINGVLDGAVALGTNLHKAANGEAVTRQDILKPIRTLTFELGNFTGIPVRNFTNYVVGVTKKVSPEAGYAWDALFEAPSYEKDIQKALERGDEGLAQYIMELSLRHRVSDGDYNSPVAAELLYHTENGESVTPGKLPSTVTAEQYKKMQRIYGGSTKVLAAMIESDAYNALGDEERVSAINTVYRTYLGLAKARVVPAEEDKRTTAVWVAPLLTSAEGYAALGKISQIESTDTQSRSEQVTDYLNGLDISNDERYLILFAAGYRSKTVLERVKRIVANSDALTDAEKQAFVKQYLS